MASTVARSAILSESGDPDSDGSSCEERENCKRLLHCDTDSSGGKKRRKQTTPVRFPATTVTDDQEESEEEEDDAEEESSEGKRSTINRIHHRASKDENLNNEFRCQYCTQFYDNKETLARHVSNEHAGTSPHLVRHSPVERVSQSRPPRLKQEPETVPVPTSPDQRESPVNLSGIAIKSFAAATNWLSGHVQSQTQQIQLTSTNEEWPQPGSAAGSSSAISNHLQSLPFPGSLAQYLPMPNFALADSTGQVNPNRAPPIGPAPVRIFNPDAYCDLCNKEFCNKYFLKTHKANKHGIYGDATGQTGNEAGTPSQSGQSYASPFHTGVGVKQEVVSPSQTHHQIIQQQQAQVSVSGSSMSLPPPTTTTTIVLSAGCDICQKRFKNEESVRKHKQKVHNCGESVDGCENTQMLPPQSTDDEKDGSRHSLSPGAMEALFKQEFGVEQEDSNFVPAPRHMSPQSIQQARDSGFNADRLRRLGVINPEAFCEICCKEYCNKYFLRTHKLKRHGIVVQENEKSPSNPGAAATWHHVQTSPLNLIVGETSGNSSESGERSGEDLECKPCGLRFHNGPLYHAHRKKIHESEEGTSPKRETGEGVDTAGADSISEDLQKLQTMILQLNGLESGRGAACAVCGKDFDTRSALRSHMAAEHGAVVEEPSSPRQNAEESPKTSNGTASNCTLCDKEFPSHDSLRKHLTEEHRAATPTSAPPPHQNLVPVPPANPVVSSTPASQPPPERRASISMTPTSSYCEICNKELCNKYFMKTHMQRMHGIEIENGAQIGGVICNICNKELCSKYFLRVHKQNTHRIVDDAGSTQTGSNNSSSKQAESNESSSADDSALKPEQLGDLSHRYFTHFTEVCPICSRRFRSTKWLKAHLLGDHGKLGVDKWRELEQQYQQQSTPRGGRNSGPSRVPQGLKIPNGIELAQHFKATDYAGLGNQVLSSLFGSVDDQQQMNTYRCSFCSFSTPVLAFLFVHERSHPGAQTGVPPTSIDSGDRNNSQCPVCLQTFPQPELLQHHLLTQHQFPGLIAPFQPPLVNPAGRLEIERESESKDYTLESESITTKDDRKASTSPQASMSGSSPNSNDHLTSTIRSHRGDDATAVQVTPQGAYKCAQCGFATANLNRIRKHIKKDHRSITGDPTDTVLGELTRTLRDVASKQKLPASYAMPRDSVATGNEATEKTIMQPFLIEESESSEAIPDKRFGPALVYLPVRARINAPLTTSFNLSPA